MTGMPPGGAVSSPGAFLWYNQGMFVRVMSYFFIITILLEGISFGDVINLPAPKSRGKVTVEEAVQGRRSYREFHPNELNQEQISQLLWSGQGITDNDFDLRAAPSAGALFPLQLLLSKKDGLYRYVPQGHKLLKMSGEDKRPSLVRAALGQKFLGDAPCVVVITALFDKSRSKYGMRGDRYAFMEAGHAAENICLQAVALGLGSVVVGSFWDNAIAAALELPAGETPVYMIPVGYIKQ